MYDACYYCDGSGTTNGDEGCTKCNGDGQQDEYEPDEEE